MSAPPGPPDPKVDELRRLLEAEIERQARPLVGCWPLLIAAAGVVIGIILLLRAL